MFWLLGSTIGGRALFRIQNLWPATLEWTLAEASWLQHGKTWGFLKHSIPPHMLNQHRVLMYAASICSWACQTQWLLEKVKFKMALRGWKCSLRLLHKQCERVGSIAVLQETQCSGSKARESEVWGHSLNHPVLYETLSQKEKWGKLYNCQMWWYLRSQHCCGCPGIEGQSGP